MSVKVRTAAQPKVVKAMDFGAAADGKTLATAALQKAIDAVPHGGVLELSAGTYLSGALTLKSNMTLKLDKDAILLGTDAVDGYQMQKNGRYNGLLNARDIQNLRIVGEGIIDGNGWGKGEKGYYRKAANRPGLDGKKSREPDLRNYGILAKNQTVYLMEHDNRDFKEGYTGRGATVMLDHVQNLYIEGVTMKNPSMHMTGVTYMHNTGCIRE